MAMSAEGFKIGWMEWEEIEPYLPQLIDMETDLIVSYHYPDIVPPVEYVRQSVARLQQHMENGNTFFMGIRDGETLYGYCWAYTATFIDELRWHERSRYLRNEVRGRGYGRLFSKEQEKKARLLGVTSMSTSVAVFNNRMKNLLMSEGFEPTRIELTKRL